MLELTPQNTADYLRRQGWIGDAPVRVEPMAWGVSNAVLRVTTPDRTFVVKQSRPRLRTTEDWFSNIDRVFREVEAMRLLGPLLPGGTAPEVLFVDRENYLFGMSHAPLDAVVWKESLLAGQTDLAVARHAGVVLGMIHEKTARQPAAKELADRIVFVQLRIDPFYQRIRERRPEVAEAVTPLIEQMLSINEALCHGDFSPKNLLVHNGPSGAFTLVDYETAHFGDPTMDLGFFLSHLILKATKNYLQRSQYFELTNAFWQSYGSIVRFKPLAELMARGIQHFAVCALARIDGTSPVDYLPEESKRETVRRICRWVLWQQPHSWVQVLEQVENELGKTSQR